MMKGLSSDTSVIKQLTQLTVFQIYDLREEF